ncbi:N,N'-diacetylbacillosaminyl-diphospho-undecaprenol alpha-1,3-N-acetylgalactosaminyltransferase [wastewater metagenome]|uniref:N, N'-diacetylbacillosaminyl-diphospho-undecaprenol alpha-1,3-N-acetylgalactosaminyltransferase n=2 Tax=unclassified sequences TaxID=12908 RepID=A0A5B8RDS5_9ZZZZ|nr:glycosyltransferase family 4 protein [Arhodomonas sp. KWT]QEA05644.1 N,N'-diacetylbacillosaminyl-diphospho-undecaprenol alpha-1,3-N-acetylgalactosaminyltransferase [uncultured organism]
MSQPVVVFAANRGYALTSSRIALIRCFLDQGWVVVLATADDAESRSLVELGARLEPVVFNRGGLSPAADWKAYRRLLAIYRRWQPSLIQHFHAKPVIFGTLAARRVLGDSVSIANAITGLGHAFITGGVGARLAGWGYAASMPRGDVAIFQNRDDRQLFLDRGWVSDGQVRLIASSGVDVERFTVVDRSDREGQVPVVVMLGRLLNQKGIPEFVGVGRRIRQRWPEARFLLAGEEDPVHPDAVTADWVRDQDGVEYLGRLSDVGPLLAEADLLLFPSYREGTPRVVLEAAATGLPTVGFDVPGVREAVRDGETGFLVADRDVDALTERVSTLLEDEAQRLVMGQAARRMVEADFDVRAIQQQYLDVYRELGAEVG